MFLEHDAVISASARAAAPSTVPLLALMDRTVHGESAERERRAPPARPAKGHAPGPAGANRITWTRVCALGVPCGCTYVT